MIAENIRKEGDINPMVPGRRMVGVFGFCDIRKFTDATEVLQVRTAKRSPRCGSTPAFACAGLT